MGKQEAQTTLYFFYKNAGEKDVRSAKQEQYQDDDEEDEVTEPYSILFEKRASLFVKFGNDTTWTHVPLGNLIMYYKLNVCSGKIILKGDETNEIMSATIIGADTKMRVQGKECIWSAIGYTRGSVVKHNKREWNYGALHLDALIV